MVHPRSSRMYLLHIHGTVEDDGLGGGGGVKKRFNCLHRCPDTNYNISSALTPIGEQSFAYGRQALELCSGWSRVSG